MSQSVTEGETVTFSASVSTTNCGFSYLWSKDGAPLLPDERVSIDQGTVVIDPVTPTDAGDYEVAIIFLCGTSPCGYTAPFPTSFEATLQVSLAADYDGDGSVEVTDLLAFLADWFVLDPGADFDGSGVVDVVDLLAFLSFWYASD